MLSVYPNPVQRKCINVHLNFAPLSTDQIVVIDNLGVEVYRGGITNFNESITINGLPNGLYYLAYVSVGFQQKIRVLVD